MAAKRKRDPGQFKRQKKSNLGLWTALALLVLVVAYLGVLELSRPHVSGDSLRFDTFVDLAERGRIKDAKILDVDSYLVGTYEAADETVRVYNAPYLKDTRQRLVDILLENRIPTTIDQQTGKRVANLASTLLPGLFLIVLFVYMILSSRRGTGLFAITSGARKMGKNEGRATFADVAGHDSAIAELSEIKQFLSNPKRFTELGAVVPKGVLLYGPPGCGKTLLVRALATEAGASFYSISGSDFVELYVGVGASRVRDLFRQARQDAPAIVFIDELDAVGRARGASGLAGANTEQEQALNQILAEMDGFEPSAGVVVIGATNRPDVLDQALLRPGRFDRAIGLERPDENARLAILTVHARSKRLGGDVDLASIARRAIGLTGADLATVMNESALLSARTGHPTISQNDIDVALKRVLDTPERQRRLALRATTSIGRRSSENERVTFADVAGQEEAVAELTEIKQFLVEPGRYKAVGANVPKGVLLFGPPGCGKTLLARALAGECNAAFFSVSASEFVEVFVGSAAPRVRDLFADARSRPPAIIFIDELDAIGRSRTAGDANLQSHSEHGQALAQLLSEMDGFTPSDGVIVLAATNRPDVLDPALLRPGRFDRAIALALPDEEARLAILSIHAAKGRRLGPDVDLAAVGRRAIGLTGADLASLINEGALLAARAGRSVISGDDIGQALERILLTPERQRRLSLRSRSIGKRSGLEKRVTFADLAGMDDAIEELAEVRDYLAQPRRFAEMGARPPRGILLVGPPGCGKTLLARAVAGEANAAFLSVAGSEFVQVFVGEGAGRVRDLFAEARAMAPAIVFVDEIDAVGARRASGLKSSGGREVDQTLNQILTELDGFDPNSGVIVIAATNRPDILDPALVRPGRIDRRVEILPPDRAGRRAILDLHARGKRLAHDVHLDVVAGLCPGFSGADLANVMNEAALLATRRQLPAIPMALLEEAVDRATIGLASRGHVMTESERRVVAVHEAGHAVAALVLPETSPPHKLTIVPRSRSLGHVQVLDPRDRIMASSSTLKDSMTVLLAGKAAEELAFGESGTGSADDLEKVTEIARQMVCELGMSPALGPVSYRDGHGENGTPRRPYSEESARLIDAEVRRLVDEAYKRARGVFVEYETTLAQVARALLEWETLTAQQLQMIVASSPRRRPPAPEQADVAGGA
ncbi:MAG: AAA family ATPase [Chloroflexi bacterium]|nr:AAA family ATPase [Chloroflexota bacterium]